MQIAPFNIRQTDIGRCQNPVPLQTHPFQGTQQKKKRLPKYFTYWRALTLLFSLCSFRSPAHSNHIRKMLNQKSGLAVTSMIEKGRNIQFGSVFGQSTNRNECARKST